MTHSTSNRKFRIEPSALYADLESDGYENFTPDLKDVPVADADQFPNVIWPAVYGHKRGLGCGLLRAYRSANGRHVIFVLPDDWCTDMRGAIDLATQHAPDVRRILVLPVGARREAYSYRIDENGEWSA